MAFQSRRCMAYLSLLHPSAPFFLFFRSILLFYFSVPVCATIFLRISLFLLLIFLPFFPCSNAFLAQRFCHSFRFFPFSFLSFFCRRNDKTTPTRRSSWVNHFIIEVSGKKKTESISLVAVMLGLTNRLVSLFRLAFSVVPAAEQPYSLFFLRTLFSFFEFRQ